VSQVTAPPIEALITLKNLSVRPILVHVNGVADSVEKVDYFDKILNFGALAAAL
jgi:hypothetical protein